MRNACTPGAGVVPSGMTATVCPSAAITTLSAVSGSFLTPVHAMAWPGLPSGVAFVGKALHDGGAMREPPFRTTSNRPLPRRPRLRSGLTLAERDGETL